MAKHIDQSRLDASAENRAYRFEYVCDFIGFGKEDIDTLHAAAPIVGPLVPAIVDAVYNKLFAYDVTRAYFVARHHGFTGKHAKTESTLTLTDEQIRFRKDMLSKYLVKLVTADYDGKLVDYLDFVGRIHTTANVAGGLKKRSSIHVHYVHVNALFGYVSTFIIEAVMKAGLPKDIENKAVSAFNKLLWIQNDFFAKYYTIDSLEPSAVAKGSSASSSIKKELTNPQNYLVAAVAVGVGAALSYAMRK